ncbi:MAG: DUF87 domain-containing protein [Pirellulales bacterium]
MVGIARLIHTSNIRPMQEQDFEKLGQFYLGKQYDLEQARPLDGLVMYDAKDLTTHALCVGMTGSGKTGLCISLLEEAAIDGIPAIIIDPKGDLGNLLLTFPDLQPSDFETWLDPADAVRKGLTVGELAKKTAAQWKDGLAQWGQTPDRIRRLREAVDVAVYTPGSNIGLPLTILRSFSAPPKEVLDNNELFRERIQAAVSGLLALIGVEGDPLRSREHILLSTILDRAWREGRDVDLGAIIRGIQQPPFDKVGYLDLESFYPAKDRFTLAMSLNNLIASPGFSAWMEGEPLNIPRLLHTETGKPRLSILSIAHLSDGERMFFVTLLLNEVIAWMRAQSGTSSLRAILYMDEVFGYFPPSANPPSKLPMLTLLKQARAFGLGVVLATQNPVDLDYKGLANCGTWFLGRLQTERDKLRLLDGLEGAAAGAKFDRARIEKILSGLSNRVFLMNNVHDDEPVVFQTRWALSFLRGPLDRDQIAKLMADRKSSAAPSAAPPQAAAPSAAATAKPQPNVASPADGADRPVLPPNIVEKFLACAKPGGDLSSLIYRPAVLGVGRIHVFSAKENVDVVREAALLAEIEGDLPSSVWDEAQVLEGAPIVENAPLEGARFVELPAELAQPKRYTAWGSSLKEALYRRERVKLWKCAVLKQSSKPGESQADFRTRLVQLAREQRDLAVEKLRVKYAPKLQVLLDRKRRAEQKVEKEKADVKDQSVNTVLSIGQTILGAVLGRKLGSATNVNRAASTVKSVGRTARQRGEVDNAEAELEAVVEKHAELEGEFQAEIAHLQQQFDPAAIQLDELAIAPKKSDVSVGEVSLVWIPYVRDSAGFAVRA